LSSVALIDGTSASDYCVSLLSGSIKQVRKQSLHIMLGAKRVTRPILSKIQAP
ncbi:hypothetical protein COCCADRAFT_113077, partial [Bipolaris zeicola 26-R-13]